ncbi:M43 family zinc metalloprotease [Polluticaenibacter yanchengensis]|uniref:M43 family zinc metalloprotease n=1 Tax=Polluticaenibacter yanchengensis TaxID=3014562 RepID=A0ABT4UKX2_9BACT|nr:M43 family zinc metalloprotease [Chitinophagaceae bacterium LY-5]
MISGILNKTKALLFLLLSVLFVNRSYAQALCGSEMMQERLFEANPQMLSAFNKQNTDLANLIRNNRGISLNDGAIYEIPVVVHVIHTGQPIGTLYNPTDEQIIETIKYINEVYAGTAAGMSGGAGEMNLRFVLAKRDPNCNPTSGINRYNAGDNPTYVQSGVRNSTSSGLTDATLKSLVRWNRTNYYNIYVVNKIDAKDGTSGTFVAGYAYYPTNADNPQDGTIMLASQFKRGDKTLPHELGHAFNLAHPFSGSNVNTQCPANTNCLTQGDYVCDTDPVSYNISSAGVNDFSCRTGTNPCTQTPYTDNTEANFMGYTTCYKLFTPGQRERLLNSLSLASRASLINSPAKYPPASAPVCGALVNFNIAQSSVTESATVINSCVKYTDYTLGINLNIGVSGATVIQLGTDTSTRAIEGKDYILTTNNNFETPSKNITFTANKADTQYFKIRVFDNSIINGARKLALNFSFVSNPGNAAVGTAIPISTINILDNDKEPLSNTVNEKMVGSLLTRFSSTNHPILNITTTNGKAIVIYRAEELKAAGLSKGYINKFGLYATKVSTIPFGNITIKMATTSLPYLYNNGSYNFPSSMTTVASVSNYSVVNNLNAFNLSTPFYWNGESNIAVEFCYSNTTTGTSSDLFYAYLDEGTASGQIPFALSLSLSCNTDFGSFSYFSAPYKPTSYFGIVEDGILIETSVSNANQALAAQEEMFVFSNNGKLIAKIKNSDNFNYGCVNVQVVRSGNGVKGLNSSVAAEMVTDKSVFISTQNSNPDGNLELTLYYTKEEVDGYVAATGVNWNNTRLVKTKQAINTYSAGAVPNGDITLYDATYGTYGGTHYTIKANVTNGTGGFTVGKPALAVSVYEFTGNGNWSDAANWKNNLVPPAILAAGQTIIINPSANGKCVLNVLQTIAQGAQFTIMPNKIFEVNGDIKIN